MSGEWEELAAKWFERSRLKVVALIREFEALGIRRIQTTHELNALLYNPAILFGRSNPKNDKAFWDTYRNVAEDHLISLRKQFFEIERGQVVPNQELKAEYIEAVQVAMKGRDVKEPRATGEVFLK